MLTYVTNKVAGETGNRQIPWQSGSMKDIFCFSRCGVSKELAERDAKIARLEAQLQQQTINLAGKVFRDPLRSGSLGPKMVVIRAGWFVCS
nr:hypothetical protein [Candidatus Marithrix sp. Canyon 246]